MIVPERMGRDLLVHIPVKAQFPADIAFADDVRIGRLQVLAECGQTEARWLPHPG